MSSSVRKSAVEFRRGVCESAYFLKFVACFYGSFWAVFARTFYLVAESESKGSVAFNERYVHEGVLKC